MQAYKTFVWNRLHQIHRTYYFKLSLKNNDHVMHHLSPTHKNVWCDSAGVLETWLVSIDT